MASRASMSILGGDRIFARRKVDRAFRRTMLGKWHWRPADVNCRTRAGYPCHFQIEQGTARSTYEIHPNQRAGFRSRENTRFWTGLSLVQDRQWSRREPSDMDRKARE